MRKLNQRGFGSLELLLVVVAFALIGGIGWYVYTQQRKPVQHTNVQTPEPAITNFEDCVAAGNPVMESSPEQCSANGRTLTNPSKATPQTTESKYKRPKTFLKIPDWNIKIYLSDFDKVEFRISQESGTLATGEKFQEVAVPSFKSEFLKDKSCTPGLSLFRSKSSISHGLDKKIGSYYYLISGGPGPCSDDPANNPDDQLKHRFIDDFRIENLEQI